MTLRVTLLHNQEAGFEQCSPEQLLTALRSKGYESTYHAMKEDFTQALHRPGDIVAIAGGDGTVGKIARQMVGRNIPIGILPLGTANNIATTLGIRGEPADIIARWDLSRRRSFDAGWVKGPEGKHIFLESVGLGMFPRLIRQREGAKEAVSRQEELDNALKHQLDIVGQYEGHAGEFSLDGQPQSGRYLMIEIMNTSFAGPNLCLAPAADPSDGMLDVTLVSEDERDVVSDFLACLMEGRSPPVRLQTHRVREIHLQWHGQHYHVDDTAYEHDVPIRLHVRLIPGALTFLTI